MATNNIRSDRKIYKVILVGDSLSGKTCLLSSCLPDQFTPNQVSCPSKTIQINEKMIDLSLVETLAAQEFDRLRPLSYVDVQIVLICFNVDDPQSITNVVEKWDPEIRHFCSRCPVVLVACKIDLRDDPEIIFKLKQRGEKPIKTKTGKQIASKIHADAYVECSAKTHEGVEELFITAARLVLKKHHYTR